MCGFLGAILWAVVLCTIAFPIASFCAVIYIILYAVSQCCPGCGGCADTFLKGVQIPGYCVNKIVHCEC